MPIALAAQLAGYEVHVATGVTNCEVIFDKYSISLHPIYLDRGSTLPIGLLRSFLDIFCVIHKLHPDIALAGKVSLDSAFFPCQQCIGIRFRVFRRH